VIIPTYNSIANLEACLRSLNAQSYPVHEIIVADNFSTDSTVDLAKRWGTIVLPESGKPRNAGSAKNVGLLNSSGNYVLFLDSDEILEKRVVEECVELCEREDVGMVKIPLRFVGKDYWSSSSAFWRNCHYAISRQTIGNFPRFFERKHVSSGAFNENLVWGEDWELYMRMKALGVGEAYCKSYMIHLEPYSLEEIFLKHLHYAKAIPTFSYNADNRLYLKLIRNAYLAFREATKNPANPPHLLAGCFLFICFKALAMMIGLVQSRLT
jgi:glycosyltransferase involved in cell wall biosynthesis